jgi:predicted nucleic acid-binding protein
MPGSRPALYYWDTCLFLAWIKDEERPTGEMAGVREVIARSKRREVTIATSVITTTEALESSLPAGMDTLFFGVLRRTQQIGVDSKIARLAHDLRNWYATRAAEFNNKTLGVADALHLATAIIYRADEFHTFDRRNRQNTLGLLPLSGNVGGNDLKICKPIARNLELDLRRPPAE